MSDYVLHLPILVRLTVSEMVIAGSVGLARNAVRLAQGATHRIASTPHRLFVPNNVHGAQAELALAKATNLYWPARVQRSRDLAPDILPDLEVRWTSADPPVLRIYPQADRPDRRFVLAVGFGPDVTLLGWTRPADWPDGTTSVSVDLLQRDLVLRAPP